MTFSRRMSRAKPSAIREILKLSERPEVLSFAGGLPAPEAFPVEAIARAHAEVLASPAAPAALQYGPTEGFAPLRAWIAARMAARGIRCRPEQVLITAGSQQGIDLVGKALVDEGDTVVVENPSYLAALQAFESYGARFEVVGSDDDGMRVDELEALLRRARPRLIYLVPTFQNPRGTTLSLERRVRLAELAAAHGVPVLEDDPYGELRYRGAALPAVAAIDPAAPVIYLSSFSKTLAPGLRLGWAVADEKTIRMLTLAKQSADLHSGSLAQHATARLFETFDYDAHLRGLCAIYGGRCEAMLSALQRSFPRGTAWTRPEGGLFVWARLPGGLDAEALLAAAMEERIAFVPGAPFFAAAPDRSTLRLNFSNRPPELIAQGLDRLAGCIARLQHGPRAAAG